MGSVLAILAVLAAIGSLFALDPGGAIAESGFLDFREMDWKQLTAWGFRTIGVGLALLIMVWQLLRHRPLREIEAQRSPARSASPRAASLPAAAVSVLEERKVSGRTLLASIIEMCQRGTLQIECTETRRGYRYRLVQQGSVQHDWERLICNRLPSDPTTVQELLDRLVEREEAIGHQLGEFLQHRGLFSDNPMRVFREHYGDGIELAMLAGALIGVGSGFWLALWLSQWWANTLVGAFMGGLYGIIATPMSPGILPSTEEGTQERAKWLSLKESLTGDDGKGIRDESDSMQAYAVALDAAQPWLDLSVSAPAWFGSSGISSPRSPDLDWAYHGFMHAPAWGLAGRARDAVDVLEWPDDSAESDSIQSAIEQTEETESGRKQSEEFISGTRPQQEKASYPPSSALDYQDYRLPGHVEKLKDGRGCGGCCKWVACLLGTAALIVTVVVVLNLVSPAVEPCPVDSPSIPHHGQLLTLLDLFQDQCVSVVGEVVSRDMGELVVEVDRGEYLQWVRVIIGTEVYELTALGDRIRISGRVREHEDGGYAVQHGLDRGWWGNLRENLPGDFLTP